MLHLTSLFLAQGSAAQPPSMLPTVAVYVIFFGVIFYFMILRPQKLRQTQQDTLVKSLKTGDKVVTTGGIHGLISNVKESTVIVKVADNVKLEVDKTCITTVAKRENEPANAA